MTAPKHNHRPPVADNTIGYQPIHHAPRQKRLAAVITGATGVVSLCMGGGLGIAAVGALATGQFAIAAGVSAFVSVVFILCAVILFRQANQLWGWVG